MGRRLWNDDLRGTSGELSPGSSEGYGYTRDGQLEWAGDRLTVIVYEEGSVGCKDLIVADLAVLGGTVTINGFHPQDAVVQLPLSYGSAI